MEPARPKAGTCAQGNWREICVHLWGRMNNIPKTICSFRPFCRLLCWHAARSAPKVAITFDDGPQAGATEQVLDALRQRGIRATFFVLGAAAEANPALVRRISDDGHEIAVHGWDHSFNDLPGQARRCRLLLKSFGIVANIFRPPGGRRIRAGDLARLWAAGFRVVLWSFDTHDSMRCDGKWKGPPPDYASVRSGDIVLLHDDRPVCVEELPRLIEALRAKNLTPVTVSELRGE